MLVRKCLKLQIKSLRLLWKRINRFKRAQCYFHELSENDAAFANIDCVVVGSDTVWNFSMPYLDINKDIFLGTRFAGKRRVSYAASVANTPYAVLRGDPAIREGLRGFDAVSVRDAYSREIVEELTGRETAVTCDPTMLVERSVLDALAKPVAEKGYILLYHFGKISGILKKRILELKAASGKKVFSFGEYRGWCDKNLVYDPIDFVSYMKNADFVVTDTFHGTIFSILYEHPFADYGTKKKKIVDLLDAFGLSDALKAEEDSLLGTLGQPPDFTTAREKVKQDRAFSLAYLRGALEPKADAILQKPTTV
jgi:polysaccharide pyruvyl transferase WcaK-like protein